MRERAKRFAVAVCRFVNAIPQDDVAKIFTRQLIRSGTSVGANQRSATLAKSDADLLNKLTTVEEEADESAFWLELLVELEYCRQEDCAQLTAEAYELRNIATAGVKTLRKKLGIA